MPSKRPRTTLPEPQPGSDLRRKFALTESSARRQPASAPPALPPMIHGELRLTSRLGGGAVTEVWHAVTPAGSGVAVKLPLPEWAGHPGAAKLVEREWRHLLVAAHPGVVRPLHLVATARGPGLVAELLDGGDLVSLCGSHPRHWARACRQIAAALNHLHERGIVHRDVKPGNVLFDCRGDAKLIDLALAQRSGSVASAGGGTPAYQSPSQRSGAAARDADDTHAFAVLLYELLTGRLPFGRQPTVADLERRPPSPMKLTPRHAADAMLAELTKRVVDLLTAAGHLAADAMPAIERSLDAIIAAHGQEA